MEQARITGIVTWSDLLKVPVLVLSVLVLAISLVAELGFAMNRRILEQYTADKRVALLLFWIKMNRRGFVEGKRPSNGIISCC